MDLKEFASKLDWRNRREEITGEEGILAKDNGFVIAYGYSDDNIILNGAIDDEVGAWNGVEFFVDKMDKKVYNSISRYLDEWELNDEFVNIVERHFKENCIKIEGEFGSFWEIKTNTKHEKFTIYEDGEKFSDGIVFKI